MKELKLEESHVNVLRQLREKSRITSGPAPLAWRELEAVRYVTIVPLNISDLLAEITVDGHRALEKAEAQSP